MQKRGLMVLVLALVFAGAAVFIVNGYLKNQTQPRVAQSAPQIETTMVVVAKTSLDVGSRIRPEHLREVAWPSDSLPVGVFKTIGELTKAGEDRVALRAIEIGEPVLISKVSGPGGRAIMSTVVDEHMRAVTIRVNDVVGVAGFVLPGDRVDILLTRDESGSGDKNLITDILLQNVRVLGVDQIASDRQDKPVVAKAVTVEVDPRQAQKLTLAAQVGSLSLALRNIANTQPTAQRTVTVRDLRTGEVVRTDAKPEVAAARPARVVDPLANIRIIRALKPSEYKVQPERAARVSRPATGSAPKALVPVDQDVSSKIGS